MENGLVKVVSPIDDTPAHRAGLQSGDLITHLDNEAVLGLTLSEAVERMRGPPDTDIMLTVRRANREPFDVTITRAVIKIQSVRSRTEGDIGYIRIILLQRADAGRGRTGDGEAPRRNRRGEGSGARSPQQPGRVAGAIGQGGRFLPRTRRDRIHPVAPSRRRAALQRQARGPRRRLAHGGADQWRFGVRLGDRRRRAAGSPPRHRHGNAFLWQGLGSDHRAAGRARRDPAHDGALLHPSGRSIQAKGIEPDIVSSRPGSRSSTRRGVGAEGDLRGALSNPNEGDGGEAAGTARRRPRARRRRSRRTTS